MARIAKPWFNKGKGWWMAWVAGRQRKLAQGRAAIKEARQRLRELLTEVENNPSLDGDRHTVASIIDAYLELGTSSISPSTLAIKEHYLQLFAEAHGFRAVAEAKPIHLTQWLHEHREWVSDWTKAHAVSVIQAAFNWAVRQELLERNPFRGVAARDGQPRRPLTRDEFQAILRKTTGRGKRRPTPAARFRQILVFLWFTGARPSEAAKLRWSDVDLENGLIVLKEHKTSHTQRIPRPRVIALHPVVVKLLAGIRKRNEGDHVFLTFRKTPWNKNSLSLRVRRAREQAGIPDDAKLYGARHAFGTRAILNGVDIKTVSELMGHTTTRMTEHYLHLAGQNVHLADAMRRANASRRGA
jgi:integrase